MQSERFDSLTRSLGNTVSRREALKLLLASIFSGIVVFVSRKAAKVTASPQGTDPEYTVNLPLFTKSCVYSPESVTFEKAGAGQVEAILQEAANSEGFQSLQWLMERENIHSIQEGALIYAEGREIAHVALVEYAYPDSSDRGLLIYASNECDEHITYALTLELENDLIIGFYNSIQNTIVAEPIDLLPNSSAAHLPSNTVITSKETPTVTGVCQLCLDSCTQSQQMQDTTCLVTSIAGVANGVMSLRTIYHRVMSGMAGAVEGLVEDALGVTGIHSTAQGVHDCITRERFSCAEDEGMCQQICAGCDAPDGITCGPRSVCEGGECRPICGDGLCRGTEACVGGQCVPIEHTCHEEYWPMGWYNFNVFWRPACCALGPALDCGARDNQGHWGGCCPHGTVCGKTPTGFGCCFPGVNC